MMQRTMVKRFAHIDVNIKPNKLTPHLTEIEQVWRCISSTAHELHSLDTNVNACIMQLHFCINYIAL